MKRRSIVFAALCLGIIGLTQLSLPTNAQFNGGVGTIEGTVLDPQGKPVTNASVTIQTSYGTHPHATHTDANGHFEFARWTAGQYDLRAYANGVFSEWTKREVIKAKKTTEVTLHLIPTQEGGN
jgi:uncharacterized GH25 family protein